MKPRIAIPVPHSQKPQYSQISLPQYQHAVEAAGGEGIIIPLDAAPEEIARIITGCDGVLLPGSPADIDPQKYNAARGPRTADSDPSRDAADELLLQDAYNLRKPVLGICYGMQSLNIWRSGTLVQDIQSLAAEHIKEHDHHLAPANFLPHKHQPEVAADPAEAWERRTKPREKVAPPPVNHQAGREVAVAHTARVEPVSHLAEIVADSLASSVPAQGSSPGSMKPLILPEIRVNSSHHQSVEVVGDGLRVAARCPDDGIIEAIEGTSPGHYVMGVQWHPERGYDTDPISRALFRSLIAAARAWSIQ